MLGTPTLACRWAGLLGTRPVLEHSVGRLLGLPGKDQQWESIGWFLLDGHGFPTILRWKNPQQNSLSLGPTGSALLI